MRAALALLLVGGCAGDCPGGYASAVIATAYFGGDVAPEPWEAFVAAAVTPAFPDGLTVQAARGQWRGADGRIAAEGSRVLTLVLPGASAGDAAARIAPVTAAYRARFAQDSVLVTLGRGCAAF